MKSLNTKSKAILWAFALIVSLAVPTRAQDYTNVIYIMCDDLGIGELGSYGQPHINTPQIDKMRNEGMKFTQHYAGTSVCAPSRSVLLTGQHTGHTYIRSNWEVGEYQQPIPDSTFTVAEMFKNAGYTTACIGKWGLGGPDTDGHPNNQGFDLFYGYLGQVQAHSYYPDHLWRNDEKIQLGGSAYSHDLVTEEALKFIGDNHTKPFFLYIPYTVPHTALQVPDLGAYADSTQSGWTENRRKMAAMITRMDRDVGRMLDTLKTLGIDSNTLVIFTSDNGPHGEDDTLPFFDGNSIYRGIKRELYEGGIRVPHIAWWPGVIEPNSTTDHISAFWDVMPTFCEIAGQSVPEDIDGKSFLPTLKNEPQDKHDHVYFEIHESLTGGPKQAVRFGDWKGVRVNMSSDMDSPIELYDLSVDSGETNNIAESHPEIVQKMDYLMLTSRTSHEHFNFGHDPFIDLVDLKVSVPFSMAAVAPNDTLQLSVDITPSNAFAREFTLIADPQTDGLSAEISKSGELIVNNMEGTVDVIVLSQSDETISDTLSIQVTNNLIIETKEPVYLTSSSVSIAGRIVINGTNDITERGFAYDVTENPTTDKNKVISPDSNDLFSTELSGLNSGTKYYLRAYSVTSEGTFYGNQVDFELNPVDLDEVLQYLAFYYPFEGDFEDHSFYANELKHVNGSPQFSEEGKFGKGLYFDGNDDWLQTEPELLDVGEDSFTFSLWINPTNTNSVRVVLQQESLNGNGRTILSLVGDSFSSYLGAKDSFSSDHFEFNKWTHIAIVGDPDNHTIQFFVNGRPNGLIEDTNLESSVGEINIGRHKVGQLEDRKFYGQMDEVMLFKKALTQYEIVDIMNVALSQTIKSPFNDILSFKVNEATEATISEANIITFTLPEGSDVTNIIPEIEISKKATISPASGVPQDFSDTVTYTVTAEDGSTQLYKAIGPVVITDVKEPVRANISVYPNPTEKHVTIDVGSDKITDDLVIRISDLTGRTVLEKTIRQSTVIEIPEKVTSGYYILSISTDGKDVGKNKLILE